MAIHTPAPAPGAAEGKSIFNVRYLELRTSEIDYLPKYDKQDTDARYAMRFTVLDDMEKLWDESPASFFVFSVFSTHSMSNFSNLERMEFRNREGITPGVFNYGNDLSVSPNIEYAAE